MEEINLNEIEVKPLEGENKMTEEKTTEIVQPIYTDDKGNTVEKQDVENMATSMTDEANEIVDDIKEEVNNIDIKNIVYEGKVADVIGYSKDCIPKQIRRFTSEQLHGVLEIYDEIFDKDVKDIFEYVKDPELMKAFEKAAKEEHISPMNKDMMRFFIEHQTRSFGMDVMFEKSQEMLNKKVKEETDKLADAGIFEQYVVESKQNTLKKLTAVVENLKKDNPEDDATTKEKKAKEVQRFQATIDMIKDVGPYNSIRNYVDDHTGILNKNKLYKKFKDNVKAIDDNLKQNGMSKFSFGYIAKAAKELMIEPEAVMAIAAVLNKFNMADLANRSFVFYMILDISAVGYATSYGSFKCKEVEAARDDFKQLCKDLISKIEEHDKEVLASKAKIKGNIMLKKK